VNPKNIRRSVALVVAPFLFALSANAQDVPLFTLFAGGSYVAPFVPNHDDGTTSGAGLGGEIDFNLNRHLGLFYGFSFHQARAVDENMVGIRYFIRRAESFRFYAHAMVGGTSGMGDGFAGGGGGGFELSLTDRIGLRVFNLDIVSTGSTGYFRPSAGLVVNLGKR
jgi:hypothetical protein